jgi:transposase, IS30 family
MKRRTRIYYSEVQKSVMWDRWQKGESLNEITRLFDRNHSSISPILYETGGVRPSKRTRSSIALSLSEREEISRGIASDESMRSIATRLGHAPSTISREIQRNDGDGKYRVHERIKKHGSKRVDQKAANLRVLMTELIHCL